MYHGYGVKMSEAQALKLRRGHAVRLPHEHLEGPHKVMLTAEQIKKLEKAKRAGKGTTLKLHPEQISHMLMEGGSVFSSLKSAARKFARVAKPVAGVALDVLKPVGKALLSEAGTRLKKKAQDKALEVGKSLLDAGLKRVGAGKRGRPRKVKSPKASPEMEGAGRRRMRGGFSFGDFVSGVSKAVDVGKKVYDIGKPIIDPLAKVALERGMKRFGAGRKRGGKVAPPSHAMNATSLRGNAPVVLGGRGKKHHKMPMGMGLFAPGMAR